MRHSRILRSMFPSPTFEGEGAGGGGGQGAAAAAAAAAAAGGQGGNQPPAGGGGNSWTPPQGMTVPAEFLGTSAEDTLGKIAKGYGDLNTRAEGLRTQLASRPGAPAKADDYTFTPGKDIAGYIGDVAKHPVMTVARNAAHKHGLSQAQFEGFVNEVYGGMHSAGSLAAPYSAESEVQSYAKSGGFDATTVSQHFTENETFAKGLIAQLGAEAIPPQLAQAAQAELVALTDTAGGNALLRALASRLGQNGIRVAGDGANNNGPLSAEELKKLGADPRIDPRNKDHKDSAKRFDPALRQRYDDGYAALGRQKYPNT